METKNYLHNIKTLGVLSIIVILSTSCEKEEQVVKDNRVILSVESVNVGYNDAKVTFSVKSEISAVRLSIRYQKIGDVDWDANFLMEANNKTSGVFDYTLVGLEEGSDYIVIIRADGDGQVFLSDEFEFKTMKPEIARLVKAEIIGDNYEKAHALITIEPIFRNFNVVIDYQAINSSEALQVSQNVGGSDELDISVPITKLKMATDYLITISFEASGNKTFAKEIFFSNFDCKDFDNGFYRSVKIGNQIWVAENFTGYSIAGGRSVFVKEYPLDWLFYDYMGAVIFRDFSFFYPNYIDHSKYDKFYYYSGKTASFDVEWMDGWHLPSVAEASELIAFVGAGSAKKMIDPVSLWRVNLTAECTNEYGFSALPSGGLFVGKKVEFAEVGKKAYFWLNDGEHCLVIDPVSGYMDIREVNSLSGLTFRLIKNR